MSAAEWKKIQEKEKKQRTGKNFGAGGARGFKSRSFNSFVDAMERGEATHLFAVNPDLVRKGEHRAERCALHAARRVLGQLGPQGQEGLDEDGLRHDGLQ